MRRTILTVLLLVLGAHAAAAKTLVFCSEGNPEALNPQLVTTTTGMNAAMPMFNNLVEFAPGSTEIRAALAESWTISDDGRTYVFQLRPGVRFHPAPDFTPTREMNADDVVFSLMRQWDESHPFHKVTVGGFDYFKDMGLLELIEAIEKVDERAVRIRLARPEAPFLANLAMPFNAILSAEYAATLAARGEPERLDAWPVGTGPFVFDGYQKDVTVRYRAFDGYWRGRQPIDTLVFSITPNPAVRLIKLKAGECQLMVFPDPADAAAIAADPALVLMRQEGFNIGYLSLNTRMAPFDDVRVRRAVNMAIDKGLILETVYAGAGVVAKNPIPPTLWSYNDDIEPYPHDAEAARRLMVEAGYANGIDTELWYMPVSRPYNPNGKRVAELIAADLAMIGIRAELRTEGWQEYRIRLQSGSAPMALFGWTGDNGDPDNFFDVLLGCTAARPGGNNVAKWCDRDYEALVSRAKVAPSRAEREELYRKAQVIFHDEAPWVPLAHSVVFLGARKAVTGFKMDALGRNIFEGVDLSDVDSR
ncbi:ABC transporter substrate-binding protein [Lutibaculum baratangense]|uniref:Dipeptide-binding ABC transporter, periplasmic substrate-binding component n=1 Tax=Lutibaculum baratangense AMV1 TaxID=631454 RepID=V4RB43_9HYPH|nr:ABC transporter substrate-binding protein [Lutibaculum baratangense]ESR22624.1 Dipeptide-binding ABC transporter, periplasmic substrate-binding component [Lutibaculum baratangense AMV1]